MSLAWGTVALLAFLLPGFLFFVGIYMPEKFTRDAAPRSVLGQLAGTILISVAIHGALFVALRNLCLADGTLVALLAFAAISLAGGAWLFRQAGTARWWLTIAAALGGGVALYLWVAGGSAFCVDTLILLAAFQLQGAEDHVSLHALAQNLTVNSSRILLYLGVSSAAGLLVGWFAGTQVLHGRLRFLAQHPWVYRLAIKPEQSGDAFTFAYLLTHVRAEDRVLLYRGVLRDFALARDGRFSYVVLTGPQRGYLRLLEQKSAVSIDERPIGMTTVSGNRDANDDSRLLVVEGEDIANVVFERNRYKETPRTKEVIQMALAYFAGRVHEAHERKKKPE